MPPFTPPPPPPPKRSPGHAGHCLIEPEVLYSVYGIVNVFIKILSEINE